MWAALIAAGASIAGAAIGRASADGDYQNAIRLLEEGMKAYENLGIPSIEAQKLVLEELQKQGVYAPQMEQLVTQAATNYGNIQVDPALEESQMAALTAIQERGEGGLTLRDQATYEGQLSDIAQTARGSRDAISQDLKTRGAYGSGQELAMKLAGNQAASSRANVAGLEIAGGAADRALQAMVASGSLSGQMRSQDYGEQSDAARAQDIINQFNTANQQSLYGRNVSRGNEAQMYNLEESQRIADTNVDLRNQERQHDVGLIQQDYVNRMAKEDAIQGARAQLADAHFKKAGTDAASWQQMGSGAGKAALAIGEYQDVRTTAPNKGRNIANTGQMALQRDVPTRTLAEFKESPLPKGAFGNDPDPRRRHTAGNTFGGQTYF